MNKLLLLFTQDGLQFQLNKGRSTVEEGAFFVTEETPAQYIEQKLADTKVAIADLLAKKKELAKDKGNSAEIAKINRRLSTLNSKAKVFSAREKSAQRDLDTAKNYHMAVKGAVTDQALPQG